MWKTPERMSHLAVNCFCDSPEEIGFKSSFCPQHVAGVRQGSLTMNLYALISVCIYTDTFPQERGGFFLVL